MPLNLANYEAAATEAVKTFWLTRFKASQKQQSSDKSDQGERSGVTAGKNLDGFMTLLSDLIKANGLDDAEIHQKQRVLTLPGYFRPTKLWDILVIRDGRLIAAIELKSQVGPSFGNNYNNRTEEAIGTAHDFWTAYREGAFGKNPKPYVGWLMLVENSAESNKPITNKAPHFEVSKEFDGASYLKRYDVLCQRLIQEQLYTSACLLASPREAIKTGDYECLSNLTNLKTFVTTLAGHIAAEAAR